MPVCKKTPLPLDEESEGFQPMSSLKGLGTGFPMGKLLEAAVLLWTLLSQKPKFCAWVEGIQRLGAKDSTMETDGHGEEPIGGAETEPIDRLPICQSAGIPELW